MSNAQREATSAIIVAAGRSERMQGADKLWAPLEGADGVTRPLLAYSIRAFESCAHIDNIALVVAAEAVERAQSFVRDEGYEKVRAVVAGGARRQDSVRTGLDSLKGCTWVAVHDAARPLVTRDLIERGIEAAQENGASCCALPASDTLKEADENGIATRTVDRSRIWLAQTPQIFRYDLLADAHRRCEGDATDDASMVEALGAKVRLYEGWRRNIKVTTQEDLALAQALLRLS